MMEFGLSQPVGIRIKTGQNLLTKLNEPELSLNVLVILHVRREIDVQTSEVVSI